MTTNDPRLSAIAAKLADPAPQGFRAECGELIEEVRQLLRDRDILLSPSSDEYLFRKDSSPESVADRLHSVVVKFPRGVHADAERCLRALLASNRLMADAVADHADAAKAVSPFHMTGCTVGQYSVSGDNTKTTGPKS